MLGVAATRLHSTSIVSPTPPVSAELPHAGRTIAVRLEDRRTNVKGYEVGAKRSGTWGFEGSTIDLKGQALLATQLAGDVVAMLREIGYRAMLASEVDLGPSEFVLTVRIHVFRVEAVPEAAWMSGDALVSFECLRTESGRRVTIDAVGLRRVTREAGVFGFEDTDYQKQFDALYLSLRERLKNRLSEDLTLG